MIVRLVQGLRAARGIATPGIAAAMLLIGGCSRGPDPFWQDQHWYGYFYEDLRINGAAELSVAYPDARSCLAGMHAYMTKAPVFAGFACARGCPAARDGGYIVDCQDTAR